MRIRESQTTFSERRADARSALPEQVRIRRAAATDAHGIAEVHVASWTTAYRGILPDSVLDQLSVEQRAQRWSGILAGGGSGTIVAEDQSEIVAFASFGASHDADADPRRVAEILAVYVSPSCRDRGFGRASARARWPSWSPPASGKRRSGCCSATSGPSVSIAAWGSYPTAQHRRRSSEPPSR